ncbi:unnamed protein product [Rhodiola kirilowii]
MKYLHQWSSATFGNVKRRIDELKESIQQVREEPRTEENTKREASLVEELDEWLAREELWWRQRSRAEWLKHGDRNTAYFHAKATHKRKRNNIDHLQNQAGELCESEQDIASIVFNYFSGIFASQVDSSCDRWNQEFGIVPRLISEEMNEMLNAPFTEGEVKRALHQMHPTKAPGLDGFPALFYQTNWEVVGNEVVKEVLNCLNYGMLNKDLNETLIVLVPKVRKVERVEDLRPISLCNVVMKLITKVLANRLKVLLPQIISFSQSAFIGGRQITDNILLAHEISHSMQCKNKLKTGYMSLKLDMSKAYDRIEWKFLEKMMLSLGFSDCWVRKIMLCVETVTYRVKINDKISEIIRPGRGLRQGDPILPYLFLICAEWLTHALNTYRELGLLEGIRVSKRAPVVTHLMFADDCLFFVKAKQESIKWLREVLKRYEGISGQKVNFAKSEGVCSKNVTASYKQQVQERLQIRIVDTHSKYLGLPLIFGNRKVSLFKSIEEKILKKTEDWKHKVLPGAGSEILIKAVLQAIPLYAMSCFKILASLCKKLVMGGIGFRDLKQMNLALLAKQGWGILTKPELLMSKVFKAKYFPNADLFSATRGSRTSYAWQGIYEALGVIKSGADWDAREGKYIWRFDGSGELTVKSAYWTVRRMEDQMNTYVTEQSDCGEIKKYWRSYWRLRIPNKVKLFGWRLYHNSLPTLQNLARRGCTVVNECWQCGRAGEDSMHLFRDCWWIRSLLQESNLLRGIWENQCADPGYWMWLCAKVCSQEDLISWLGGLWLGWKDRNEKAHGGVGQSIVHLRMKLKGLVKEWRDGCKELCWWEKQNISIDEPTILCDGSFDQESKEAGVGAVLLWRGTVARAFVRRIENTKSAVEAELRALRLGMELAEEMGLTKVSIFSDSCEAIWALNLGCWRSKMAVLVLKDCISVLDAHPEWQLGSIFRESNGMADWLTRKARVDGGEWADTSSIPKGLPVVESS